MTTAVAGQLCTVQLPGGGVLQARGDAAVGDRVFVRAAGVGGGVPSGRRGARTFPLRKVII
jgi:hypothetical protein